MEERGEESQAYLSSEEAAAYLGVKRSTLYSYVSRGMLRAVPGGGRRKQYRREDLRRLKQRSGSRAGHAAVASAALAWGEPVLDSAIGQTGEGRFHYRGRSVLSLQGEDFESVCALLWTGELGPPQAINESLLPLAQEDLPDRWRQGQASCLDAMSQALGQLALRDMGKLLTVPGLELQRGWWLLQQMVRVLRWYFSGQPLRPATEGPIAAQLAEAIGPQVSSSGQQVSVSGQQASSSGQQVNSSGQQAILSRQQAINAALVLSAEHGLNVSSFTARVIASSGADIYACLRGALAALSGPRHGGYTERVEALLEEMRGESGLERALSARLGRGEAIPGFGHPLYPGGDPRARRLLELASSLRASQDAAVDAAPIWAQLAALLEQLGQERATLDYGLVSLRRALGMPRQAALAMFALGRMGGWIAHILEQREQGQLIRPRARYVGQS